MTHRLTTALDEAAFVRLLRAAYGESYAYQGLYATGGFAALLATGKVQSWGDFDAAGELFSHTAFLAKDPRGEYVESGLSMRNPWLRTPGRTPDRLLWPTLFEGLPEGCAYVHQHTTTVHPLAQRYAHKYMRAVPTGFVAAYSVGETVTGFAQTDPVMHALAMTTECEVVLPRTVQLPKTAWSRWITDRLRPWARRVTVLDRGVADGSFAVSVVEDNRDLGLRRRAIDTRGDVPWRTALDAVEARVELVHVPLDGRASVLPTMMEAGYLPVGVRVHPRRPDEVILQHLPRPQRATLLASLGALDLATTEARTLLSTWIETCAQLR